MRGFECGMLLTACALIVACAADSPDSRDTSSATVTGAPAAPLPADVVLTDSQPYQSEIASGTLALLYVDSQFVDSVDATFGVHVIGADSLLFLPVRAYALDEGRGGAEIGDHVLLADSQRIELEPRLPYFDSYFSSPVVAGDVIIYWGLRRVTDGGGVYDLYAMRHDLRTRRTDSLRLDRVGLYTDFRFHLPPPVVGDTGGAVRFAGDSATYLVGPDFTAMQRRPRAPRR